MSPRGFYIATKNKYLQKERKCQKKNPNISAKELMKNKKNWKHNYKINPGKCITIFQLLTTISYTHLSMCVAIGGERDLTMCAKRTGSVAGIEE